MPINFPSSPTNGQAYTENSTTWIYDTTAGAWVAAGKSTLALSNTSGVSFAGDLNFPTGNIGIGWSSPTSNLHVVGTANITSSVVILGNVSFDTTQSTKIVDSAANVMTFHTTNIERLRIDSAGYVAIGNTNPVYPLQVDGQAYIRAGATNYSPVTAALYITYTGAGSMYGQAFQPVQNTTTPIIFYNAGRGSIGSISQNTSHVAYNTTSDYRLKGNVVSITDGSVRLSKLKPRRFNFLGETYTMDGFIAHEVQSIVPEAVTGEKDAVDEHGNIKPQVMDAAKLVPLLTATVQELMGKIESLEKEMVQIKKIINSS